MGCYAQTYAKIKMDLFYFILFFHKELVFLSHKCVGKLYAANYEHFSLVEMQQTHKNLGRKKKVIVQTSLFKIDQNL